MILEPGDPDTQPGTWKRVTMDGEPTVRISCPACGLALTLEPNRTSGHVVESDGSVVPSIVCVGTDANGDKCFFHEYVELRGWVA